ncbi:hypothetical protein EYB31_33615 [Paenibacillus thalictri]|uniref:Uncharacterized protein n=1 Tax=Paenibacillus thalictri TaxID=2527873 RepID=A0A4Q9DEN7_9BACL|nr:hypothetical protein EYB31_33615 [Paenibacillus thalictri]
MAHDQDEALYFSENYKKPALRNGKVASANYTKELADSIQQAYTAGYKSNSKLPKFRKNVINNGDI